MLRILVVLLLAAAAASAATAVPIVVPPGASPVERLAATELAAHLAPVYPEAAFPIAAAAPKSGPAILIEPAAGMQPESFRVTAGSGRVRIAVSGPRAALAAVYTVLEKIGYGFYLSYDAAPAPRKGLPRFEDWAIESRALTGVRMVFNWHNFLSSASTWELEDWQRYIAQSAKMRFNTVMVHAYGNNPMFTFRHNGREKPVGYLSTTSAGRDWGTQHVNDIRLLFGGELFKQPVFGASVAMVPEAQRAPAAIKLMQQVFAYAAGRGLGVTFALDVDTESANPPAIIETLPESARIFNGKVWLANPNTPEGYEYYRSVTRQLLETYPQIDRLAVWFRNNRTPWRDVEPRHFPPTWKTEFEGLLDKNPAMRGDKESHGMFVMAKLLGAFRRALTELGRRNVELATGTWRFDYLPAADYFLPRDIPLISLDWETHFETDKVQRPYRAVSAHRKQYPIVWAHHDDRTYIGRPYTPYPKFSTMLKESGSAGYGIIHWTTRPLDLYFKSLAQQVWSATVDEPLARTTADMAASSFGEAARGAGGAYLERWVREAPMFGRETTNRFIDVALKPRAAEVIAKAGERRKLLDAIPAAGLTSQGREWLAYFQDFERFVADFFAAHAALEDAQELRKKGGLPGARAALAKARPEDVIRQYAGMSRRGRISRGEEALIISLNLRWLPYFVSERQALGLEPVRYRLGPTQHEPLAQGAGSNTFYFDKERRLWKVLGEKETGGSRTLRLTAIMGEPLPAGSWRVAFEYDGAPPETTTVQAAGGQVEVTLPAGKKPQALVLSPPA